MMETGKRPFAFRVIIVFLVVSIVLLAAGQTTAVFDYDLAARMGLQEDVAEISEYGVQVNRAFGAGDTLVYIPLMIISLVGLILRKRWSLVTTAAVMGISVYWTVTVSLMMSFLKGVPGYTMKPGPEYWVFIGGYLVFGLGGLAYLLFRGDNLIR